MHDCSQLQAIGMPLPQLVRKGRRCIRSCQAAENLTLPHMIVDTQSCSGRPKIQNALLPGFQFAVFASCICLQSMFLSEKDTKWHKNSEPGIAWLNMFEGTRRLKDFDAGNTNATATQLRSGLHPRSLPRRTAGWPVPRQPYCMSLSMSQVVSHQQRLWPLITSCIREARFGGAVFVFPQSLNLNFNEVKVNNSLGAGLSSHSTHKCDPKAVDHLIQ